MAQHQINLTTFGQELADGYQKVLGSQSKENWVLFGYDKASNDLKVINLGDGGLEELRDEFEESKVQYAFTRVLDDSTGLTKYVFINWCGDGVPVSKKALIASHVNDVKTRICKGFHVEVTARQEQDVEPSVIMKKVRDSSGAKYSHQQKDLLHVKKDLVPGRDDSLTSQGHETVVDGAQRIRAEREARERELVAREKASQQQQIKPVEQVARPEPKSIVSSSVVSSSSVSAAKPVETGNTKSVRNMWADREKKGSAENLSSPLGSRDNLSKAAPLPPRPQPSQPSQASQLHQQQQQQKAEEEHRQREQKEREEMERERAAEEQRLKLQKKAEEEEKEEEERQRILAAAAEEELMKQKQQAAVEVRVSSPGLTARALYDYNATEQNEISFREGSTIYQVVQVDDGWWHGSLYDDGGHLVASGLFPSNYVEMSGGKASPEPLSSPVALSSGAPVADSGAGFNVRALYDYTASESNELTFTEGQVISNCQKVTDEWWSGTAPSGQEGLFPHNYVELL